MPRKISTILVIICIISLFHSCKDFYDYQIKNAEMGKRYPLEDKKNKIIYEFSGRYTWILNEVYSSVGIKIKNKNQHDLLIDFGKIKLISKNYNYKQVSMNEQLFRIKSGESASFTVEFLAPEPNISKPKRERIPGNEELTFSMHGLSFEDVKLEIEEIYFVPES